MLGERADTVRTAVEICTLRLVDCYLDVARQEERDTEIQERLRAGFLRLRT